MFGSLHDVSGRYMCSEDRIWAMLRPRPSCHLARMELPHAQIMMAAIGSKWSRDIGDQVRVVVLLSNRFERA